MTTDRVDVAGFVLAHDPLWVRPRAAPHLSHDLRSDYVEMYWLPLLGPSCIVALRRFGMWFASAPEGVTIALADLARQLGLGPRLASNAPVVRTLARIAAFGLADLADDAYCVTTRLPDLPPRHVEILPSARRALHPPPPTTAPVSPGDAGRR